MPSELRVILCRSPLFKHLSTEEIDDLCKEAIIATFPAGKEILNEGDIGDNLYIIISGSARVFTHDVNNKEIELTRLQTGDYFGEQALLGLGPMRRNANVQALTNVSAVSFPQEILRRTLALYRGLQNLLEEHGQRQLITKLSKQLQDRSTKVRDLFSLFGGIEQFRPRQILFRQGDAPEDAYLLLNGSVDVKIEEHDKIIRTSHIAPGQIFGEQAVIENSTRAGTATVGVEGAKVILINNNALRKIYKKNSNLNKFLLQLKQVYSLPTQGVMTRYRGRFLGNPAVQTNILKPNREMIIVSNISNTQILAICYALNDDTHVVNYHFADADNHARDLHVLDGKLVGVISLGSWDDLENVYRQIDVKINVTPQIIEQFKASGKIGVAIKSDSSNAEINTIIS